MPCELNAENVFRYEFCEILLFWNVWKTTSCERLNFFVIFFVIIFISLYHYSFLVSNVDLSIKQVNENLTEPE